MNVSDTIDRSEFLFTNATLPALSIVLSLHSMSSVTLVFHTTHIVPDGHIFDIYSMPLPS